MSAVRTVRGDVAPEELGVCDAHDHLFLRTPLLPGEELDNRAAAGAELAAFADAGGRSLVQWTPHGLGRRAGLLPALSARSGVHLVAATGLHQARHHSPGHLRRLLPDLDELFVRELTEGIGGTGVRAGVVKVGVPPEGPDPVARHVLAAAATAHRHTGAPVVVHTEAGTDPRAVVAELCDRGGVPPARVVLGHLGRRPDATGLLEALRAGVFAALDGPSRRHAATNGHLLPFLTAAVDRGHVGQLLLGGDTTTPAGRAGTGGSGAAGVLRSVRAALVAACGADVAAAVLVANPARAFAARWPVDAGGRTAAPWERTPAGRGALRRWP